MNMPQAHLRFNGMPWCESAPHVSVLHARGEITVTTCEKCMQRYEEERQAVRKCAAKSLGLPLAILFAISFSARAEFVAVKATTPDAVGHIELKPSVAPHAVEGTATIEHNGELHENAIPVTMTVANGAISGTATANVCPMTPMISAPMTTAAKTVDVSAPITFNGTPNMLHFEIIVPPNAIVIHAEGATETAVKPFQQIVSSAVSDAREYAFWIAIGAAAVAVVSMLLAIAVHFHHMKERAKLEAKA